MKPFWKHVPDEMERHILAKAQRSAYLFDDGLAGDPQGDGKVLLAEAQGAAEFFDAVLHGRTASRTAAALRRGFSILLPLAALLLFLPTIFLFYNSSAWVYAPAYALIVLAGNGAGKLFHGKR